MSISERDKKYIWHPYTQMHTATNAIGIQRGKGSMLYGEDGKEYIDAVSSWWVNLHGHAHPYIAAAIARQATELEQVIFAGFSHEPAVRLAEMLLPHLPGNQARIFYSDNGSTAVEAALKMTLQYFDNKGEKRRTFIAFRDAYHGDTFGSMSVSARGVFTHPFHPLLFDVQFVDTPTPGNEDKCLQQFRAALTGDVAGFIFEPLVLGSAGMFMYTPQILDQLIALAQQKDVICIADEVFTGFGRTGKMFACDYLASKPDIMCFSKGITGGFIPLGVTSSTQKIYEAFLSADKMKMLFHGHSYTANPLACAAAVASLEVFGQEKTLEKVEYIIKAHQEFTDAIAGHPKVGNIRQTGTIIAFDFRTEEDNSYLNTIRDRLYNFYIEQGVVLRPLGNTVYILPPYCITQLELAQVYNTIKASLAKF
jgi:adenosylmethionine-8-amino-7-oxononanoate aminotransferase